MKTSWFKAALAGALLLCAWSTQAQLTIDSIGTASVGQVDSASLIDYIAAADGIALPIGDIVRIGTFTLSDAEIQASQADYATLNANFKAFDTILVGDGTATAGYWTKSSANDTDGLQLTGHKIYLWAFNSADPQSATQQGIFTSAKSNWIFPSSSGPIPGFTAIELSDVAASEIVVGSFNGVAGYYALAPVPEPAETAAFMAGICLLGALARRFRGFHLVSLFNVCSRKL